MAEPPSKDGAFHDTVTLESVAASKTSADVLGDGTFAQGKY